MKHEDRSEGGQSAHQLGSCVRYALEQYFEQLNGHDPGELYRFVLSEVEKPLLQVVMEHTSGNISRAAQVLGLNRGTLRKKLKKYGLQ